MTPPLRLATTLVLAAALAASPSATHAAPRSTGQCPASSFCVWGAATYTGAFASTASTSARSTGITTTKSVWNRSSYAARVYSGSAGSGTSTCYAPGAMVASTTAASVSFRILTTTTC